MKNKKKAESIAWIIIAVTLLSIVMLGLLNILNYNDNMFLKQGDWIKKIILNRNSINIWNKVDIRDVNVWEDFYIYKNNSTKKYEVFTWSSNQQYKNIDHNWNYLSWWVYKRTYKKLWNFWDSLYADINIEKNNFDLNIK